MKENIFGKRLRALRLEQDLTCEELGKILNKGRSTVSHWETAKRNPDLDDLLFLAKFFDVTTSYLLGETDDRKCGIYKEMINGHDVEIKYKTEGFPEGFTREDAITVLKKLQAAGIDIKALK